MHKKRLLFPSKKAQITIFIILGIFVVFVFLFLIRLNAQATLKALETSREDILLKGFKKEALRIFVEDCLRDELRQGLRLLGKQGGRIWNDQPGGLEEFQPGTNGVRDDSTGDRVAYGLLREGNEKFTGGLNAYPCNGNSGDESISISPFCKYAYPGIFPDVQFGLPLAWESLLEEDLESYLKVKSHLCIETFLREKVKGAEFTPTEFVLDVDLKSDGISVEAFYPLRFSSGKEKFFQLSRFDFFYPTSLRKFLQAAVFFPLQMDWQYVDFPYLEASLKNPTFSIGEPASIRTSFSVNYRALGIQLQEPEFLPPTQDTLFTFTAPFPHIVDTPEEFVFKVARQNRPPALDYISRQSCAVDGEEPYDYLVVKGADEEMGELRLELKARDPDLDEVPRQGMDDPNKLFYSLDTSASPSLLSLTITQPVAVTNTPAKAELSPPTPLPVAGIYPVTAKVQELSLLTGAIASPLLEDSQEVRIKIDYQLDPAAAKLEIKYPWDSDTASYPNIISREDPFRVEVQAPSGSSAAIRSLSVGGSPAGDPATACFVFPTPTSSCDFSSFAPETDLQDQADNPPYKHFLLSGILQAQFSLDYCGESDDDPNTGITSTKTRPFTVQQCIPYVNDEHPFSYIPGTKFYKTTYSSGPAPITITETDAARSPYAASHMCCSTIGTVLVGQECKGPPNCAYLPVDFTGGETGYVVVEHAGTCERGNLCSNAEIQLFEGNLKCGDPDYHISCNAVEERCQGTDAWGFVGNAWCHGKMGCELLCVAPNIVIDLSQTASRTDLFDVNAKAKGALSTNDAGVEVICGICSENENKYCDSNRDGIFEGKCQGGTCIAR